MSLSPSIQGFDPDHRIKLRSLLHTRNLFTRFPPNHTLSRASRNLKEHRLLLLGEVMRLKIGVSGRTLPGWEGLKRVLEQHLLPVLADLIDRHRRYNYQDGLLSAFRKCRVAYPENTDESAIPIQVVFTFLIDAMRNVLPYHLVGNNSRGLEKLGRSMVRGLLPLCVQHLMNYVTNNLTVGWLSHVQGNSIRRYIAAKLSLWVASDFIPSVVQAGLFGTRMACVPVFFTKPAWQSRTKKALNQLMGSGCLRKMPRDEPVNKRLEPGFLKFMPKSSGLRPIVSRRLQSALLKSKMYKAKLLMKKVNPRHLQLNEEWTKFRQTVLDARQAGKEGRVFFVKSDIRSAFVTIRQQKVLEVLAQHVEGLPAQVQVEQRVYIKRPPRPPPSSGGESGSQGGEGASSSQPWGGGEGSSQAGSEAPSTSSDGAETSSKQFRLVTVSRDSAYRTLRQEVEQQVVRCGSLNFSMRVGLAQGSPLSNNLSNMTLEHLFSTQLAAFNPPDGSSVLWRVADDFLLLTLSEDTATRFKEVLSAGFPDYGWEMSAEKSVDNVGRPHLSAVTFSGAFLNLASLEALADLSQHSADSVLHAMSFHQTAPSSLNDLFKKQLFVLGSLKIEPLFLNPLTLSRERLLQHISASGKLQALRLRALTRYLQPNRGTESEEHHRSRFLSRCIRQSVLRICRRVRRVLGEGQGPSDNEVKWLLYMAVYKRSSGYLGGARPSLKKSLKELEALIPLDCVQQCYDAHHLVRSCDARDQ